MIRAGDLKKSPLFAGIDESRLAAALAGVRVTERRFTKGEVVTVAGDPLKSLLLLVEGRLVATIESPEGRSLMVETLAAPEALAVALLYCHEPHVPVTLTGATDGRIASIARTELDRLAERFPSIYRALLAVCGDKFSFITTKMRLLHFTSIRERVARYLLGTLPHAADDRVLLPYNRERLAELFGVARPSLSRVLGELSREGVIEVSGRTVRIRDRRRLAVELDPERSG